MKITNLTPEQVDMLNFMWYELESYEEFEQWMESLSGAERKDAELLQRLIIMESMEEHIEEMKNFPDARRVLVDIMSK